MVHRGEGQSASASSFAPPYHADPPFSSLPILMTMLFDYGLVSRDVMTPKNRDQKLLS